MAFIETDTIAAVATPRGEGGIGIVRLSGPASLQIARSIFRREGVGLPDALSGHTAYYGTAVDALGETIDECLLTWFPAPHSYTVEEVVELSAHGSDLALARILTRVRELGARLAEPGEFTRRAFLNGRLDLARAEAVIDIIRARTDAALRVATRQLAGRLSGEISALRQLLIGILAEIEATIDFPDDVEPPAPDVLQRQVAAAAERVESLLATAELGRLYREGASVVIAGRPNVGKSSLLNALLGADRAIVTAIPGTTRDVIEEAINLEGIPVRLIDTAGLRETADPIEQLGVARTRSELQAADLSLLVIDVTEGMTGADRALRAEIQGPLLLVANKSDLLLSGVEGVDEAEQVSALTGAGMAELRSAVRKRLVAASGSEETVLVSNARHRARLEETAAALREALAGAAAGVELAALAVDLKIAAESLGEVTGETVTEATISEIFARFCVGK